MKRIRPSVIGMIVALVVTALAAASWAAGLGGILGIVLLPGGLLGWAFVYGDNIRSPDEVMGTITLISLTVNAIAGLLIGASIGWIGRLLKRWKHKKYGEQVTSG
jgi:hypothetical protein